MSKEKTEKDTHAFTLKKIPIDVVRFIVAKQGEFRSKRLSDIHVSYETTIIRIIKSHPEYPKDKD